MNKIIFLFSGLLPYYSCGNQTYAAMINDKIKKHALKLSSQERAELAHLLIDSLQPEEEIGSEDAWAEELKKRVDRYELGLSSAKPWTVVKFNAQAELD